MTAPPNPHSLSHHSLRAGKRTTPAWTHEWTARGPPTHPAPAPGVRAKTAPRPRITEVTGRLAASCPINALASIHRSAGVGACRLAVIRRGRVWRFRGALERVVAADLAVMVCQRVVVVCGRAGPLGSLR